MELDNLKLKRKQIRRLFTKSYNEFEALNEETTTKQELLIALKNIEDKANRLFELDTQVSDAIFKGNLNDTELEDAIADEFDSCESYKEKWLGLKVKFDDLINKTSNESELSRTNVSSNQTSENRNFRFPKLEIKAFDGDLRNWLSFWGQFRKIHEDPNLEPEDKFQYLVQATVPKSRARELVESYPPSKENYQKAIDVLKNRFARDELLIEVYVRDLLGLVLDRQNKTDSSTLSSLYDKIVTKLHALESLGVTSEKYAAMLFPLVESSLPEQTLQAWERYRTTNRPPVTEDAAIVGNTQINYLGLLLTFLKGEVESEERLKLARSGFAQTQREPKQSKRTTREYRPTNLYTSQPTAAAMMTTNSKMSMCLFCSRSSHLTAECTRVTDWSLEKKKELLRKSGGCFVCLKHGHNAKTCRSFVKCLLCKKRHHTIMCPNIKCDEVAEKPKPDVHSTRNKVDKSEDTNVLFSHWGGQCFLQTLVVRVNTSQGIFKFVRVLLDSGSQRSYIAKSCIRELNLKGVGKETVSHSLFGGVQVNHVTHNLYDVTLGNIHSKYVFKARVMDQDKICNFIPRFDDRKIYEALQAKGITLTDMDYDLEVEILLGADIISQLLTTELVPIGEGLVAVNSKLGWTVIGQQKGETPNKQNFCCTNLNSLDISQVWKLDVIGITDPTENVNKSRLEEEAMEHFKTTVTQNEEGRYIVQLPWISGHPELLPNEDIAGKRIQTTTKRLMNEDLMEDYSKVFCEWEELNIIEKVSEDNSNSIGHFIPHHPVVKQSSITTKVRPVFDASAKDRNGNSLNDCLVKGPNLVEVIPNILMRFRLHEIGVSADIAKAFLQIGIQEKDRDFLKFLWWKNDNLYETDIYRHCRVVFGLKSSPFLLGAVINHLLDNAPETLKDTAGKLKESFYVDNCVTSVGDKEELSRFMEESKTLMMKGKFDLRCWVYSGMSNGEFNSLTPLLGLMWDSQNDLLSCNVRSVNIATTPVTKRVLLSVAQSIFDPIGFTSPVSLVPKLLLQETWKMKISWDTPLPEEITKPFNHWMTQIHLLNGCFIPRKLSSISLEDGNYSLHVFSDASKVAYAACIFIRVETEESTSVRLVTAKSRIAPCKEVTIPRLELLAALIATRLYKQVHEALQLTKCHKYFWTDSTVVLTWINKKDDWSTFVANRCNEIRKHSDPEDWQHVPGHMNPADLPSRGCTVKSLSNSKWWEGPEWLYKPENEWPKSSFEAPESEINKERKKTVVSATNNSTDGVLYKLEKFSDYTKILRTFAWLLRFVNNTKKPLRKIGELTGEEVRNAENKLIGLVQKESFPKGSEKSFKNLQVFKDNEGVLNIKSRLILGDDTEEFKCPIVLPSNHTLVRKLIRHYHEKNQHAGVQTLLHILREQFWILGGRKTVKSVLSECLHCKRHSVKSVKVPFAPLPKDRIKDSKTFEVTGVDLAGPLFLKSNEKAWVVLFSCAVYRAVHIELITSLSTDAFLQALRRFIARRGRPSVIYSDNGTNFHGASNAFNRLNWDTIIRETSVEKITWKFNPPSAAWWGGWWERLIGMLKDLIRRSLGKSSLFYEELYTVLCDCESVLNARPLTYVSSDNNDLIPLSPATFLQNLGTNEVVDIDSIDKSSLTRRLRYTQKLREDLRSRFRKEYLGMLVNYGGSKGNCVNVGDVVLVEVENLKRISWPLAIVKEVFQGRDGVTRVVRLKTANGELTRPVQRLYPLEINQSDGEILNGLKEDQHTLPKENDATVKYTQSRSGREIKTPQRLDL